MELPLDPKENFAALRRAVDNLPEELASTRGYAGRLFRLLEQIIVCTKRDGCVTELETLAAKCHCSKRTVQRYLKEAEKLGWLKVEVRRPLRSRYWIDWYAVYEAGEVKPKDETQQDIQHDTMSCYSDMKSRYSDTVACYSDTTSRYSAMMSCSIDSSPTLSPKKSPSVLSSEQNTHSKSLSDQNSDRDSEMEAAVARRCLTSKPNAIREASEILAAEGWLPGQVAEIEIPSWWKDPPTPAQLVDQARIAKAKSERVVSERLEKQSRNQRIRDQAARAAEQESAEDRLVEQTRAFWKSLPEAERQQRIAATGGSRFFPQELLERQAILRLAQDLQAKKEVVRC